MKYFISALIGLFACVYLQAQPVKEHGFLQVRGTQLTDEHGAAVVLQGMSFGWSCFHPRFYTAGAVNTLVEDWKCSVIRAAMGIEPENGYKQDSATNMRMVKTVIDACIQKGVYVIVDWHSHNINLKEAIAFFKTISESYHAYPNIIYEVFNEPDQET